MENLWLAAQYDPIGPSKTRAMSSHLQNLTPRYTFDLWP